VAAAAETVAVAVAVAVGDAAAADCSWRIAAVGLAVVAGMSHNWFAVRASVDRYLHDRMNVVGVTV
jgi:hypothetical protein